MKAQIFCRAQPGVTVSFELRDDESVVGRERGIAVSIPVEGVSRRHARITREGSAFWLEDLKSTNGTFLNGAVVHRERLRHRDVVTLGKAADLIFVLRGEDFEATERRRGVVAARLVPPDGTSPVVEVPAGEITLGRSEACNVVVDSSAVSKIHARIERSVEQLVLQDLGSSNGTFVNGHPVRTAVLRHGDEISLGAVEAWRVEIDIGEVETPSGVYDVPKAILPELAEEGPHFSPEWKTRFDWSEDELQELKAFRDRLEDEGKSVAAPQKATPPKAAPPGAAAPPKEKPPAAKPPAPKPAEAAPAARPAPAPAKAPTPPPTPEPAKEPETTATMGSPAEKIVEVRLEGKSAEVVIAEPGEYSLGRSRSADFRIDHKTVSRRHARVVLSDDRHEAFLQHDGGTNGTRLNGRVIDRLESLKDGDTVQIGEVSMTVTLKRI